MHINKIAFCPVSNQKPLLEDNVASDLQVH